MKTSTKCFWGFVLVSVIGISAMAWSSGDFSEASTVESTRSAALDSPTCETSGTYVEIVTAQLDCLRASWQRVGDLAVSPLVGTPSWNDEMDAELLIWWSVTYDAQRLQVPVDLYDIHTDYYAKALALMDSAANDIKIWKRSPSSLVNQQYLEEATTKITRAAALFRDGTAELRKRGGSV